MPRTLRFPPASEEPAQPLGEVDAQLDEELRRFKAQLHHQLVVAMDLQALTKMTKDELRQEVRHVAEEICHKGPSLLNRQERERLVNEVLDETFGLGPLEVLLSDPTVSDILIN